MKKQLIAVLDSRNLILYDAEGATITSGPRDPGLTFPHHARPEKGHGSYNTSHGYNISASDPHTMPKEVDQHNAARLICEYLGRLMADPSEYEELILVAEPRMLGCVREHLSKNLANKITKEIHKDLVNEKKDFIENAVFGA